MTARKSALKSDFAKADAYLNTEADYDELPEVTDADMDRAVVHKAGEPVRRGRPKLKEPKEKVTIRLDKDVAAALRTTGPRWQTRVNTAIREWLERQQ
jgi:uncharacterized protein (DUF4415 family)